MQTSHGIALEHIRTNIDKFGYHTYMVQQSAAPRFAYTIGLSEKLGTELIFAGASYFMADEVFRVIKGVVSAQSNTPRPKCCVVDNLGSFDLRQVHDSWSRSLMLGAFDYYQRAVLALQIVPDEEHFTIDIPDCHKRWSAKSEPAWQWLHSAWQYAVPSRSTAVTDINALRGKPIVQAARWEVDQWELFSAPGDQFSKIDIRVVPLGTLLAFDLSLNSVTNLEIGHGVLRRAQDSEWASW